VYYNKVKIWNLRSCNNMSFEDVLKQQTKSPGVLEKERVNELINSFVERFKDSCVSKASIGEHTHCEYIDSSRIAYFHTEEVDMYNCELICGNDPQKRYCGMDSASFFRKGLEEYFENQLFKRLKEVGFEKATILREQAQIIERRKEYAFLKSWFKGIEQYNYKDHLIATVTVFKATVNWN